MVWVNRNLAGKMYIRGRMNCVFFFVSKYYFDFPQGKCSKKENSVKLHLEEDDTFLSVIIE